MAHDTASFFQDLDPALILSADVFEPIDLHFARFMVQLSGSNSPELILAAALVSRLGREGHTCMDLNNPLASLAEGDDKALITDLPSPEAWMAALRSEPVVGSPGEYRPLILDEAGRLYFYRSYENEQRLAGALLDLNAREKPFDQALLHDGMICLFPDDADGNIPQKIAALIAVTRSLCVITGGPGTGKTTLVCKILALLLEQDPSLKIALAAPTGKAARRIEESIQRGLSLLDCTPDVKAMIPHEASTIHRLLGFAPGSSRPRNSADNPLRADVVVIDEASMADLALMSNLVQALKVGARLILLGDKNQLASVQAGYVLGDICDVGGTHEYSRAFASLIEEITGVAVTSSETSGMQDSLVELTKTYRFAGDSPIYHLSTAVNAGDAGHCLEILGSGPGPELGYRDLPRPEKLRDKLQDSLLKGYKGYLSTDDIHDRFRLFDTFRILCPVREGPYGVKTINRMAEGILRDAGLLEPGGPHYHGRPVLITQNDYTVRLFNGDIGLILNDDGALRACFQDKDGSVRKISPMRLPEHETAWAMTVHKSQGSEFDRVLFVLPDRDSPILTRELVYTGITRARNAIEIWASDAVFSAAVARRTQRSSGLNSLLWAKG